MLKALLISLSILITPIQAFAADEVGSFWRAKKTSLDGQKARVGDVFKVNQLIETGRSSRSKAEITTRDNSRYILYKNSSIRFEEFDMSGSTCNGMKVTLTQGKLRGTSGACGHGKTEIKTSVAAAFAWGTDYEMVFVPEGKKIAGYENVDAGFYQKVNEGKVMVENAYGSLLVNPGEAGFVSMAGTAPVIVPLPDFFTNTKKPTPIKKKKKDKAKKKPKVADQPRSKEKAKPKPDTKKKPKEKIKKIAKDTKKNSKQNSDSKPQVKEDERKSNTAKETKRTQDEDSDTPDGNVVPTTEKETTEINKSEREETTAEDAPVLEIATKVEDEQEILTVERVVDESPTDISTSTTVEREKIIIITPPPPTKARPKIINSYERDNPLDGKEDASIVIVERLNVDIYDDGSIKRTLLWTTTTTTETIIDDAWEYKETKDEIVNSSTDTGILGTEEGDYDDDEIARTTTTKYYNKTTYDLKKYKFKNYTIHTVITVTDPKGETMRDKSSDKTTDPALSEEGFDTDYAQVDLEYAFKMITTKSDHYTSWEDGDDVDILDNRTLSDDPESDDYKYIKSPILPGEGSRLQQTEFFNAVARKTTPTQFRYLLEKTTKEKELVDGTRFETSTPNYTHRSNSSRIDKNLPPTFYTNKGLLAFTREIEHIGYVVHITGITKIPNEAHINTTTDESTAVVYADNADITITNKSEITSKQYLAKMSGSKVYETTDYDINGGLLDGVAHPHTYTYDDEAEIEFDADGNEKLFFKNYISNCGADNGCGLEAATDFNALFNEDNQLVISEIDSEKIIHTEIAGSEDTIKDFIFDPFDPTNNSNEGNTGNGELSMSGKNHELFSQLYGGESNAKGKLIIPDSLYDDAFDPIFNQNNALEIEINVSKGTGANLTTRKLIFKPTDKRSEYASYHRAGRSSSLTNLTKTMDWILDYIKDNEDKYTNHQTKSTTPLNQGGSNVIIGSFHDYYTEESRTYIMEDNRNDPFEYADGSSSMKLPKSGTLKYDLATASDVVINNIIDPNYELTQVFAEIDFEKATDNLTSQIEITRDNGNGTHTEFLSNEVAATLEDAGIFSNHDGLTNNHLALGINGSMMGNNGSHIGMAYRTNIDNDIASGTVLLKAVSGSKEIASDRQENGNLIMMRINPERDSYRTKFVSLTPYDGDGSPNTETADPFTVIKDVDGNTLSLNYCAAGQLCDKLTPENGEPTKRIDASTTAGNFEETHIINEGTTSESTIHWGWWQDPPHYNDLTGTNNENPDLVDTTNVFFMYEDFAEMANTDGDMHLPKTGSIEYDIAAKSALVINASGGDEVTENYWLDSASLNIDFGNNEVDTSLTIGNNQSEPYVTSIAQNDQGTSSFDNKTGRFFVNQGFINTPNTLLGDNSGQLTGSSELNTTSGITTGAGAFTAYGAMMGANGSHAGMGFKMVIKNHEVKDHDSIVSGMVLFKQK